MLTSTNNGKKYLCKTCQASQATNVKCVCCDQSVPQHKSKQYIATDYDFSCFVVAALLGTKPHVSNDTNAKQLFICNACGTYLSKTTDANPCVPLYACNAIAWSGTHFLRALKEKPEYICTCCHHLLFHRSVVSFHAEDFSMTNSIVHMCLSY